MPKTQKNKFKCSSALWRKFTEKQREVYNNIRAIDNSIIHPGVPLDSNVFNTISHNYACLAAWEFK